MLKFRNQSKTKPKRDAFKTEACPQCLCDNGRHNRATAIRFLTPKTHDRSLRVHAMVIAILATVFRCPSESTSPGHAHLTARETAHQFASASSILASLRACRLIKRNLVHLGHAFEPDRKLVTSNARLAFGPVGDTATVSN